MAEPAPSPSWKDQVLAALPWLQAPVKNFLTDDGSVYAAGIAFYALVSLLPLGACAVAVVGAFLAVKGGKTDELQAEYITDLVAAARRFIPILPEGEAEAMLKRLIDGRRDIGLFGFIGLLGAAGQVVDAIRRAVTKPLGAAPSRLTTTQEMAAWQKGAVGALAMVWARLRNFLVIITLGFFVAVMRLALTVAASLAQVLPVELVDEFISAPPVAFTISQVTGFTFSFLGYLALVTHIARKTTSLKGRAIGAALFGVLMALAELVYANYVVKLSNMSLTYGSLAGLIAIALWIFYASCVFLLCVETTALVSNPARLHLKPHAPMPGV